jgi:hypothetical protein
MQNTRLNNLFNAFTRRLAQWIFNPWRRISILIISFLLGFFLGSAVATTSGQTAEWDVVVAGSLVLGVEIANRIFYNRSVLARQVFWVQAINYLKVGLTYSLFLEAFKLGS